MGGGGGFENMYDTLFCASEVPPIRLLLSVNFGLFQALDARADLSLGLTGFGVKISDLKVSNTNIVLMDYANIQVDWIPYYKMLVQCSIEYLGIIEGKGYIVVDTSTGAEEAFEAYAKAGIKIPDAIPLIGGIEVGNAALGLNTTRIWGALKVLGFSTGICYVYGGDLSFGSQANVEPTYPQYLEEAGTKDINGRTWYPVGYDENKKDTLYMSLGSNIRELSSSDSGNLLADDSGNANSNLHSDTLFSIDEAQRVIYLNTFSKTIAPSIRISYMILPPRLMEVYREKLGFYACTVSGFEQYTLAKFMAQGRYEQHLSRMKARYRQKRDAVIAMLRSSPLADRVEIMEQDAGLHFLVRLDTRLPDAALRSRAAEQGVRLALLSDYYSVRSSAPQHIVVVNYSGIDLERLPEGLRRLAQAWEE